MEQVKILIFALVSFLSTEVIPIGAKSARIEIDRSTKQIRLYQNDIYSLERYKAIAKSGLDTILRTSTLNEDLAPITMTSKHFYEEEGKLNAILYLSYQESKDLRKISFYVNERGDLSYPYMKEYDYGLNTGFVDGRFVRFNAENNVDFTLERKEYLFEGIYSLAQDWKDLELEKFQPLDTLFSAKHFERVRRFIFENGDRSTYRNFDNQNPHYRFDGFDVYLGTGDQKNILRPHKTKMKEYTEMVIRGEEGYFTLFLKYQTLGERSALPKAEVYWHNRLYANDFKLKKYLLEMLEQIKQ